MKSLTCSKTVVLLIGILLLAMSSFVHSHCQIPCGIYDDGLRFKAMREHITTIEKSMKQITYLSATPEKNMNQIARWISNKEKHSDELSEIVTYYFMAQRTKPVEDMESKDYKIYVEKLTLAHRIVYYSMKAKQSTDMGNIEKLRSLLEQFDTAYNK